MLSAKMKAKKYIIWFFPLINVVLHAGIIHHSLISITEQKVMGHMFKHVMTSAQVEKDEFFIDGYKVSQESYYKDLELALEKERKDDLAKQEKQRRAQLEFSDTMQVEVSAKLLQKILDKIDILLAKIDNPALERFFVFQDTTVNSLQQLHDIKNFIISVQASMVRKIESFDYKGLNLLIAQLELWPDRLEKFFQTTVHQAIKKSDDTAMLKELLRLVSEPSFAQ
jgi:hypothetical protein